MICITTVSHDLYNYCTILLFSEFSGYNGMVNDDSESKGWCITTIDSSKMKNEEDGFITCPVGAWNAMDNCSVDNIVKNYPKIPRGPLTKFHCYMQVRTLSWLAKYAKYYDNSERFEKFDELWSELEEYHEGLRIAQLITTILMSLCSFYVIYLFYYSLEIIDCNISKAWWINMGLFIFGIIMSSVSFIPGIEFHKSEKENDLRTKVHLILAYIDFYETTISVNIFSAYLLKGKIGEFAKELLTYTIQPKSKNTLWSGLLVMLICWSGTMFVIMDLILEGWHSVGSLIFISIISIIRIIATHWRLWMKDSSGFMFKFNIDFACCIKDKKVRNNSIEMIMKDWKIKREWNHGTNDCQCNSDSEFQA